MSVAELPFALTCPGTIKTRLMHGQIETEQALKETSVSKLDQLIERSTLDGQEMCAKNRKRAGLRSAASSLPASSAGCHGFIIDRTDCLFLAASGRLALFTASELLSALKWAVLATLDDCRNHPQNKPDAAMQADRDLAGELKRVELIDRPTRTG